MDPPNNEGNVGIVLPRHHIYFFEGAWLGLAFVTAVMILSSKKKFMVAAAGGLAGIVLLPLLIQFAPQRLVDRYDAFVNYKEEASAQSRFLAWELCGRVGLRHPFNGGGFDFYSDDIYADYIPESMDEWYAEWGSAQEHGHATVSG